MEKAELTRHVLQVLRRGDAYNIGGMDYEFNKELDGYESHDALLLHEIMWELLVRGVIAPGRNSHNLELPNFHVTEYGRACLEAQDFVPQDPHGYLAALAELLTVALDPILETYLRESLHAFQSALYLAATVMLGVAAERCVDLLSEAFESAIADPAGAQAFRRDIKRAGRSVKRRFDIVKGRLLRLTLPADLSDSLDIILGGVLTLIRYTRNSAGHPTGKSVERRVASANLAVFPTFCERAYGLVAYLQANTI